MKDMIGLYQNPNHILGRGRFLKKYANRKYSISRIILFLLGKSELGNVLDVGCGSGYFLQKLQEFDPESQLFGLDVVSHPNCQNLKIDYRIYDGFHYPSYQHHFDHIFCMNMLYHIPDRDKMLRWIKRHLSSLGKCFITTKSKHNLSCLETIHQKICQQLHIDPNSISNHVDSFCSENAIEQLVSIFSPDQFSIHSYEVHSTLLVDNYKALLWYIFSTSRYQIKDTRYISKWYEILKNETLFIDHLFEKILLIKCR